MNGKEETLSSSQIEETFRRLSRITFSTLVDRLQIYWVDQKVIDILADNNDWGDCGGNFDPGGWTRSEFTEECMKQFADGNFTKEQYLIKTGLT